MGEQGQGRPDRHRPALYVRLPLATRLMRKNAIGTSKENKMPETVDLQKLADIQAIRRIKGLYCDTIDRIIRDKRPDDTEKLRALFTENAVIDFTLLDGKVYSGRDMILELFTGVMPAMTSWMWHTIGAEVIDIDGHKATGRWTLYAMAQRVGDPSAPPFATYGRYIDEFERVDGVWRQSRLFFLNETKEEA